MLQFSLTVYTVVKSNAKWLRNKQYALMFLLILVDAYVGSLNSVLYLFCLKYRLAKNKRQIAIKSKHWEIDFNS